MKILCRQIFGHDYYEMTILPNKSGAIPKWVPFRKTPSVFISNYTANYQKTH